MTDSEKTDLPGSSRGDDHRETPPQDQHPTVDLSFSDSDRITERDPVESLVAECLARVFAEGESVIEEICANNPENAGDIRAALEALKGVGFTETPSPDFPERLGDFRLRRRLGGGGMGVVYVAEQVSLRREVALKLIRPDQLYFPSARTRFAREIDAIARLQHPGVVPIYAVGEERGLPFFAMELVSGATLAELLSDLQHRLPSELSGCDLADALAKRLGREEARPGDLFSGDWTETCLRIGLHVAEALDHVHGRGILHRDVKPSNVMLTLEGRVLLVDFGLASFEESARITQTGSQPGSLAYMSPEQLEGSVSDVDPRTDIYSLGVTLYEMLGLELPFRERTSEALKSQILAGSPPSLRQRGSTISWETETVCFKAMDPARQSRYASARDLAEDLEHVLRHQPIAARRPGLSLRVKRWMQRHPTASASGAVIALAIAIGSTIVAWQQSQARHALDDSNAELKVAVEKANAESQRARRHFEQTRRAIQEVLFEVGHLGLRDEPHSERVRTRILERAIEHFRELSSENTDARDDPVLRLDIARTQIAMADLLQRLRRDDEALEACGQVRDLITGLTVPTANRPVLERARSEIRKIEADLLSKKGRESEARSLLESNIERLGNLPPESQWSTYAVDHAASWQALGALQLRLLELKDARSSLQRSWEILSPLQAEGGLDLEGARILATTLDFLGSIAREEGDLLEAERQLRRSLALRERLSAERPEWFDAQRDIALSALELASVLEEQLRFGAALETFGTAIERLEAITSAFPDSPTDQVSLCAAINNRARLLENMGEAESVLPEYERAELIMNELVERQPDVDSHRENRAVARMNIGRLARDLGDFERGEARLMESLTELNALAGRRPERPQYREDQAHALDHLGLLYEMNGQVERAEPLYRQALDLATGVTEEYPEATHLEELIHRAEYRLAYLELERQNPKEALELLRPAIAYWRASSEAEPANPQIRYLAAQHEWLLIQLLLMDGQAREAAQEIRGLADRYADRSGEQLMSAELMLHASRVSSSDEGLMTGAFELLRRGVERGDVDPVELAEDPRFRSLHEREEWTELLESAREMQVDWGNFEAAWSVLGLAGQDEDAYQRAATKIGSLREAHPDHPDLMIATALAELRLGNSESAIASLSSVRTPPASGTAVRRDAVGWLVRAQKGLTPEQHTELRRFLDISRSRDIAKEDPALATLLTELEAELR